MAVNRFRLVKKPGGQVLTAISRCDTFARICKPFRHERLQLTSIGDHVGQPPPVFRGRLRSAFSGCSWRDWRFGKGQFVAAIVDPNRPGSERS
jgi:hypothetical protein